MTTKLTLTVEKSVIEKAKLYAKNTGRSLSEMVESYLDNLTQNDGNEHKISHKLNKIVGSVNLPEYFDEKKELRDMLEKKHLRS